MSRWVLALLPCATMILSATMTLGAAMAPGAAQGRAQSVDTAIVLALDCSWSIDAAEFRLQTAGLAAALRDAEVQAAMFDKGREAVAVSVMQWSHATGQAVVLPWQRIADAATADELADLLEGLPRRAPPGATSIGGALEAATRLLAAMPWPAARRLIDVSGDGRHNNGPSLPAARAATLAAGITVNGLAITHEVATLDRYFAKALIGGPGAFVERAVGFHDYAQAMRRKLLRELAAPRVARAAGG